MATTWMHSDAAVGEESQPRVPGLSMRKQNQSGNCTVAVPGVWLSRFWPDDRQVFVQLPGICWVFFIDWSSFPCHRHTRDRVSSLLCRLATGCAAHPAAHPPSPHREGGAGSTGPRPQLHPLHPHPRFTGQQGPRLTWPESPPWSWEGTRSFNWLKPGNIW